MKADRAAVLGLLRGWGLTERIGLFSLAMALLAFLLWGVGSRMPAMTAGVLAGAAFIVLIILIARRMRVLHERITDEIRRVAAYQIQAVEPLPSLREQDARYLAMPQHLQERDSGNWLDAREAKFVPRVVSDYIEHLRERDGLRWLHRSLMRMGSAEGRDLPAAVASSGRLTWSEIRVAVLDFFEADADRSRVARSVLADMNPRGMLVLARIAALQALLPEDRRIAYSIYEAMRRIHGDGVIVPPHQKLHADLAFLFHEWKTAESAARGYDLNVLERQTLAADLANPFVVEGRGNTGDWLEAFNAPLRDDGLAVTTLADAQEGAAPFDRLSTAPLPPREDGPRVTVAITTWSPDQTLRSAVGSILAQSWRNLEILIVDDCSDEQFLPVLEEAASLDPRIRLIRMERNGGTYLARNRAIQEATGDLFTVNDSDDWSHPQRIELQVDCMLQDPTLMATSSRALRCTENLVYSLPGVSASRENASSLMFWRRNVVEKIGYYDASRKGADSEYAIRIIEAFGHEAHRVLPQHLAFIRLRSGSLSREEFKPGWRHPARAAYRRSYHWWHQRAKQEGRNPYRLASAEPEFPLPLRFVVDPGADFVQQRRSWDVVFVADYRKDAERPSGWLDEIVAATEAGMKVAVMHKESLRHPLLKEVEPLDDELQEMIGIRLIGEILPTDAATTETVVVRDPSVLQFAPRVRIPLEARRVLLVEDDDVTDAQGRLKYAIRDCENAAFAIFGCEATWYLRKAGKRRRYLNATSARTVSTQAWPEIVSCRYRAAPRPAAGNELVVGKIVWSRGAMPALSEAGPVTGEGAMGGWRFLLAYNGALPACFADGGRVNWSVVTREDVSPEMFYASIDVYICHGSKPTAGELRSAREAAAAGCVLLAPPTWEAAMAGMAIICEESDVLAMVEQLTKADACTAQKERASRYLMDECLRFRRLLEGKLAAED